MLIGSVEIQCLLDTGAQVSTITESFFREHLAEKEGQVKDVSQLIRISAAQSLEIPYVGYVELPIQLFGHVCENMGFLIVKDPVGTTLSERKKLVPGVIGSNIFRDVREVLSAGGRDYVRELEAAGAHAWAHVLALYCEIRVERLDVCGRVRVGGKKPQLVPAHSLCVIQASTQPAVVNQEVHAMVECMDTISLQPGLAVGRTCVKVDDTGNIPVQIANFSDRDIYLHPKTTIGKLETVQ